MQTFIDDDRGFIEWRDAHPNGFVLNTARTPKSDYLVLHLSRCRFLNLPNPDLHWTKDYIKFCSTQFNDIVNWVNHHVAGHAQITRCQKCNP